MHNQSSTLGLSALLWSVLITAPAGAADSINIDDVVVSGTRHEESALTVPASIQVIDRKEIEASGASHIVEVLRGRGGIQVSDLYGDGTRATVGMRGFGESANANTLILIDGRRLNNNDIAPPDLNSISLRDVDRIEIVQGSAGALYGDQAVGGIINIITRKPGKFHAELSARAGSYTNRGFQGLVSQQLDSGLSYRASGEIRSAANYRDHNDLILRNFFGRLGYEYSTGSVFAEFQQIDEDLLTPGALFVGELAADRRQSPLPFASNFTNTDTTVLRTGVKQNLTDNWALEAEATHREVQVDFRSSFRTFLAQPSAQTRKVETFAPRLIGVYPFAPGDLLLTLGYDWEYSNYKISSQLGEQQNDQKIRGLYAQTVIPLHERLSATLGIRRAVANNDLIDSTTFPTGLNHTASETVTELGLNFRPSDSWRLFARRDENFRFAKVDELTDPAGGVVLKTQTGVSYELGAEWRRQRFNLSATLYRLNLRNEIAVVPGIGLFGAPANTNIPQTRRDGMIVGAGVQASRQLYLSGDYSYIDSEVQSGLNTGKRIPFVAKHSVRIAADYQATAGLDFHAELQGIGKRVFSGDFNEVLDRFPGYAVINLKAAYRLHGWQLSGRINNLLDRAYSDFGARSTVFGPPPTFTVSQVKSFLPAPERNFMIELKREF